MTRRDLALLWHQVRYEQLSFWRNPQSAFFTFVLPVGRRHPPLPQGSAPGMIAASGRPVV